MLESSTLSVMLLDALLVEFVYAGVSPAIVVVIVGTGASSITLGAISLGREKGMVFVSKKMLKGGVVVCLGDGAGDKDLAGIKVLRGGLLTANWS